MNRWEQVLVSPDTVVLDVIGIIDRAGLQIALVVDEERRLLGTVTDGDVRRGLLRGVRLQDPVSSIMNPEPTTARLNDPRETVFAIMKLKRIHHVPVLDAEGRVVHIETLDGLIQSQERENWVVIMAGGLGMRLRPLTDHVPKPLLRVGNKPLLETIIGSFVDHGFRRFYLSVNYKAEMIKNYFGDGSQFGIEIRYLHEERRMGTAGALSLIRDRPNQPLIVMNGDLLTKVNFKQLLDFHNTHRAQATMCVREYTYQIPYGVVQIEEDRLVGIVEKPQQSCFVNAGIYVLEPDVLDLIPRDTLSDMPDLFAKLIQLGCVTAVFPIREYWLDIGLKDDFERANGEYHEVFG
ncbi:MAG: nucleotidyltransferase family protein [Alicyclobacillus macrosporangiidus]|uniref:nucleotidyltransferase family protein n=1 Tax=Alicyclobacillus macrosporangiidus TaxID=392015 RepID=UPI0026E95BB0|nr:nucleotidyltransferase family protein [Alicyclobacillus macrosporangiidus]MCL6598714.1 nucleotidyltransferase family protein [Alicyclobacillus macrosporangiidus]